MFVIFDSLLRWQRGTTLPVVGHVTAAIVVAFTDRPVYSTHDTIGFELAAGDLTVNAGRRRRRRTALLTRPRR